MLIIKDKFNIFNKSYEVDKDDLNRARQIKSCLNKFIGLMPNYKDNFYNRYLERLPVESLNSLILIADTLETKIESNKYVMSNHLNELQSDNFPINRELNKDNSFDYVLIRLVAFSVKNIFGENKFKYVEEVLQFLEGA